ncbi:UMP kinase [Methanoplanus sp. FWC-SCC4]|uniref:Uridylate kinase n=1 Tax=Methanochimaera problematica TaxID=2609417 RepID=A0AA97FBL8_9EURY|nr:UMP kinase [Methanoplanus sp. FWC-SCC4]WOF16450.1 UMP kinase [Methanoplanus sp. FWC-SCC4]
MKKIVISLGGSILVPSLESNNISKYVDVLKELSKKYQIFVVIGGGGEARRYINVARSLCIDEATSDELGIMVTRINASLLAWALGNYAHPCIPENYTQALSYAESGKIVIMGGVTPGQTTDAVSAVLAERTKADLLINATSVDGIYSADPKKKPDAEKFDKMTPDDLIEIVSGGRMNAGSNNVIDLVAAKVTQRSGIPMVVLQGTDIDNLKNALISGEFTGTTVSYSKEKPLPL